MKKKKKNINKIRYVYKGVYFYTDLLKNLDKLK